MKQFHSDVMDLKSMSNVVGGSDSVTHDTTILLSRKTRVQKAVCSSEDEPVEIIGTLTIDKEK